MKDPIYNYFYQKAEYIIAKYEIIEIVPQEFRENTSNIYSVADKNTIFQIESVLQDFAKDEKSYIEYFARLWNPFKETRINIHNSLIEEYDENLENFQDFIDSRETMEEYLGEKSIEEIVKICFESESNFMLGLNARAHFNCIISENKSMINQSENNLREVCTMECNRIATYYTGYQLANLIYGNEEPSTQRNFSMYN